MELFSSPSTQELSFESATLLRLCEAINTPRSLTVYLLVKHGEWEQYLDLPLNHSMTKTVSNFADDYLVSVFLRKSPNLPISVDKAEVARRSFFACEEKCRDTNLRFRRGGLMNHHKHFLAIRKEVAKILGPLSSNDLKIIERSFNFGPGANIGVRGRGLVLSDKYDNNITLTRDLYPFYKAILGDTWWKYQDKPSIVKGNRFTTVPKDARKDRGICVEPLLNSYVQLGIGARIRSKLRTFGLDLNSQARNQYLASQAHRHRLATIDLESASDTISLEVVRELLPPRWFHLLSLARSKYTVLSGDGGEAVELEKFSSMGNGYTFELESLLFFSIVRVIVPSSLHHLCSVYGDDIIVPQDFSEDLIETLEYFGFKVNTSKSFLAGNFFESCGTDWYLGTNVRPIYAKGAQGKIPYALQLANKLRMYSNMRGYGLFCDSRFKPVWEWIISHVKAPWRSCHVPPELGDTGIISDISEAKVRRPKHSWYEGLRVKHVKMSPIYLRKETIGRHLLALRSIGFGDKVFGSVRILDLPPTFGKEPRRGFLARPMTKWVSIHCWPEGLLWSDQT